jgi:hypothetical protein
VYCNGGSQAAHQITVPAPKAKITKAKISSKHQTAKFAFTSTAALKFQCALVKKPKGKHHKKTKPHYAGCKSPKTYKHVKPGNYTFYVRTVSGTIDGAAASKSFKVG